MRQRIATLDTPQIISAILASVMLIAPTVSSYPSAALWALIVIALGAGAHDRWKFHLQPAEKLVALLFAAYFLVGALRGLAAPSPSGMLAQMAPNLVFLLAAPLFPMLRRQSGEIGWANMLSMLAVGGVVIGLYSLYYAYTIVREFDPPTGNPLILALFCGLTGLLLFERAMIAPGRIPLLHIAGFCGGSVALWLTARRSVIIAYLICTILLIAWNARRIYWGRLAAALGVIAACCLAAPTGGGAVARISESSPLSTEPAPDGSTGDLLRKSMLIGGARAFLDRPVLGHGRQNAVAAANALRNEGEPPFDHFNHLHSAPLTEAVSAGVFGLTAFLALFAAPVIALRGARGGVFRTALAATLFFALCSSLNVGFYVDATASGFVLAVAVLNALGAGVTPPSAPAAS